MKQENTVTEHYLTAGSLHLADVLEYVDTLHTAASDGDTTHFAQMSDVEIVNALRDMIYVAQETIREIEDARTRESNDTKYQPQLRIIK